MPIKPGYGGWLVTSLGNISTYIYNSCEISQCDKTIWRYNQNRRLIAVYTFPPPKLINSGTIINQDGSIAEWLRISSRSTISFNNDYRPPIINP